MSCKSTDSSATWYVFASLFRGSRSVSNHGVLSAALRTLAHSVAMPPEVRERTMSLSSVKLTRDTNPGSVSIANCSPINVDLGSLGDLGGLGELLG